jgi:plastocyanin
MLALPGSGWKRAGIWLGVLCAGAAVMTAGAQQAAVTVQVEIVRRSAGKLVTAAAVGSNASNVAVWLTPLDDSAAAISSPPGRAVPRLLQRNKAFEPHVLIVQAGTVVQFPNQDPFFHNVFSLFAGKRFDLGLYEAGSSRSVRFERPGASFLFCNIHPEMSAVVVVVETPYFGLSDRSGQVAIGAIPDGRYQLRVWYERSATEDLKSLERIVTVSASSRALGPIQVVDSGTLTLTHKNKYGQDYPPSPERAAY